MPLTPGTRLGHYEIREPIGAGGMGEVYRAVDTRLSRAVALKILPEHLASHSKMRERFEREARAIRFSTLEAICGALACQPGDLLQFESEPVVSGAVYREAAATTRCTVPPCPKT